MAFAGKPGDDIANSSTLNLTGKRDGDMTTGAGTPRGEKNSV